MVPEGEALRVVHVHLGIKGGAERFFVSLVNALAERGVEQKALIFPDRVWKKDIEAVCGIEEMGVQPLPHRPLLHQPAHRQDQPRLPPACHDVVDAAGDALDSLMIPTS